MTATERKRHLYRISPTYRAKTIERVREYHQRHLSDPVYRELVATRKRISGLRDSISVKLERVAELERRLIQQIKNRDALQALRKRGAR
jgi:hypothetical protein